VFGFCLEKTLSYTHTKHTYTYTFYPQRINIKRIGAFWGVDSRPFIHLDESRDIPLNLPIKKRKNCHQHLLFHSFFFKKKRTKNVLFKKNNPVVLKILDFFFSLEKQFERHTKQSFCLSNTQKKNCCLLNIFLWKKKTKPLSTWYYTLFKCVEKGKISDIFLDGKNLVGNAEEKVLHLDKRYFFQSYLWKKSTHLWIPKGAGLFWLRAGNCGCGNSFFFTYVLGLLLPLERIWCYRGFLDLIFDLRISWRDDNALETVWVLFQFCVFCLESEIWLDSLFDRVE